MGAWVRDRLTFANVIGVIALFAAIGLGTAWALEDDSVKSRHIVNGAVKKVDLSVGATFISAELPDLSAQPETNECPMEGPGSNLWAGLGEVGYYRDAAGFVHLEGHAVRCGDPGDVIFNLPPGFRPKDLQHLVGTKNDTEPHPVEVGPFPAVSEVKAENIGAGGSIDLDGISFRCAPSGHDGCP